MTLQDVTNLQRRLRDWAQQPSTERNFKRGPEQMIEGALQDPRRVTQLSISGYLLGTWHLGAGQARVLQGDGLGWDAVRLGLCLQRTALLLRCAPGAKARNDDAADRPGLQSANSCCLVLALADPTPDGEELMAAFAELPDDRFGEGDAYPLFVRELLRLRDQRRPTVSPRLGPYAETLQLWDSDEGTLSRRLQALCDLHLEQTRGQPGAPASFDEPGLMLYPAEILAVRSVRRALGKAWPKVEHPLLFTNLVQMQPDGPWPEDPLLDRLLAARRKMRRR